MTPRMGWVVGLGAPVVLMSGVAAYGAVDSGHRWLTANLRPAVFDRAVWCWQDTGARARIAGSESRRDAFVIRTALLGAAGSSPLVETKASIAQSANAVGAIDRDAGRLGYVYAFFWTADERRRLFDHVAASRPICSPSFGRPATRLAG